MYVCIYYKYDQKQWSHTKTKRFACPALREPSARSSSARASPWHYSDNSRVNSHHIYIYILYYILYILYIIYIIYIYSTCRGFFACFIILSTSCMSFFVRNHKSAELLRFALCEVLAANVLPPLEFWLLRPPPLPLHRCSSKTPVCLATACMLKACKLQSI